MKQDSPIHRNFRDFELRAFSRKCRRSEKAFYNNYIKLLPGMENLPEYSRENYLKYRDNIAEPRIWHWKQGAQQRLELKLLILKNEKS